MPKILGIDIPGKKRVEYSLRSIYGIGLPRAQDIVRKAQIDPAKRADGYRMCRTRSKGRRRRRGLRWCGTLWGTASDAGCMKSRKSRIMGPRGEGRSFWRV